MSSWILRKKIFLFLLAAELLSACLQLNDSPGRNDMAITTPLPETPQKDMDDHSSNCRLRDELPLGDVTTLSLPEIDVEALLEQDQNLPKDAPLRFATSIDVNIDPGDFGNWEITDNMQVWRLRIISPRALSLSLGFTTFNLPPRGCLFVYSPDHSQVLGPYTNDDNEEHGQLWTPTVDGEEVFIELSVPKEQISRLRLVLGSVNQGYKK